MTAGYQMKGNIVFYLLMKYVSLLTSCFSAICLWLNSCHMGICWLDCSRMQPDIDVSKNAIFTITNERQYCFLPADEIFVTFNEPFFRNMSLTEVLSFGGCVDMVVQEYILISMFPRTPYAQSAAAEWLRGNKCKAISFSICWWNIFHF